MSTPIIISESTLTDRYQTTVPEAVRKALHLHKREKVRYTVQADGHVLLSRADEDEEDQVMESFLQFLANDIAQNPDHLQAVSSKLVSHVATLISDVDINLDEALPEERDK